MEKDKEEQRKIKENDKSTEENIKIKSEKETNPVYEMKKKLKTLTQI